MILSKSKIYEIKLINLEISDIISRENYIKYNQNPHHACPRRGIRYKTLGMGYGISKNYMKFIYFFISYGNTYWEYGLYESFEHSRLNLIDHFISRGSEDWICCMSIVHKRCEKLKQFLLSKKSLEEYRRWITDLT